MGPGRFALNIGCTAAVLAVAVITIPAALLTVFDGDYLALMPAIQLVALVLGLFAGLMAARGRRTGRW